MGATGRFGWGGDRRSGTFLQLSASSKQKDANRLNDRNRDRTSDEYRDYLGAPSKSVSSDFQRVLSDIPGADRFFINQTLMDLINPKYFEDSKYKSNCALCTAAIILRARGYDVEAMPRDEEWRGASSILEFDYKNFDNYVFPTSRLRYVGISDSQWLTAIRNPNVFKPRGASVTKTIMSTMQKWGDGSVGELSVCWNKSSGAHSLAVVNIGGTVSIVDGQNGKVYSGEKGISALVNRIKPGSTMLCRYDNAKFKSGASDDLAKIVKRK